MLIQIQKIFNVSIGEKYNTLLIGGFDEPCYLPANEEEPAQIQFTKAYVSSALHEVSHWCIAGEERLLKEDFGYHYIPSPRTRDQQLAFFSLEVKSQALEWIFHDALRIKFNYSFDNLDGVLPDTSEFENSVILQKRSYLEFGLPKRGLEFNQDLVLFVEREK